VLPHINDTFLLLFGVLLAVTLQMSPGQQPWLMAKLIALVIYIGLGVMALKRPAAARSWWPGWPLSRYSATWWAQPSPNQPGPGWPDDVSRWGPSSPPSHSPSFCFISFQSPWSRASRNCLQ
jgi:hypothetical protein